MSLNVQPRIYAIDTLMCLLLTSLFINILLLGIINKSIQAIVIGACLSIFMVVVQIGYLFYIVCWKAYNFNTLQQKYNRILNEAK